MKKEKLTAAYLALYLGQECKVFLAGGFQAKTSLNRIPLTHVDFGGNLLEIIDIKPILRPLSDMTEEEACELYTILHGGRGPSRNDGVLSCLDYFQDESTFTFKQITHVAGFAAGWRYLLSIGIDLFGWIDAGLAIDKTKMEKS